LSIDPATRWIFIDGSAVNLPKNVIAVDRDVPSLNSDFLTIIVAFKTEIETNFYLNLPFNVDVNTTLLDLSQINKNSFKYLQLTGCQNEYFSYSASTGRFFKVSMMRPIMNGYKFDCRLTSTANENLEFGSISVQIATMNSYEPEIHQNQPVEIFLTRFTSKNSVLFELIANDEDLEFNNRIQYRIEDRNSLFKINETTGAPHHPPANYTPSSLLSFCLSIRRYILIHAFNF